VLRLWPEEIQIGLFSDHCWLRKGRSGAVRDYPVESSDGALPLLRMLEAMLDDAANAVQAGSSVVLTVSDTLAAIVALPWQDSLRRPEELKRYARILFERNGTEIGSDWAVHGEAAGYESLGLAYAFPHSWLSDLEQIVVSRSLRLLRVLPASGAALHLRRGSLGVGHTLFVLKEQRRASVLSYVDGALASFDVEPATASTDDAMLRLLRRTSARCGPVARVTEWRAQPGPHVPPFGVVTTELPDAGFTMLLRETLS
jgi:hypothetical protein